MSRDLNLAYDVEAFTMCGYLKNVSPTFYMQLNRDKLINHFRQPTYCKCNVVCRAGKIETTMNWYHCSKCNAITQRNSESKRIKSMCDITNKTSFLIKIESADKLAIKLRRMFLKNQFELSSFSPKERSFLEMAFEQGVKVTFNGLR